MADELTILGAQVLVLTRIVFTLVFSSSLVIQRIELRDHTREHR